MKKKTIFIGEGKQPEVDNTAENIFWEPSFNERILNDIQQLNKTVWGELEIINTVKRVSYLIKAKQI